MQSLKRSGTSPSLTLRQRSATESGKRVVQWISKGAKKLWRQREEIQRKAKSWRNSRLRGTRKQNWSYKGCGCVQGCHDNYRQQSPQRQSRTLFLGAVYSSACEAATTLFLSSPDVIVTASATMKTLMRSTCNCSLLIKSHSFPLHGGTMGRSPGRWLSSYSPGAIIAAKPLPPTSISHSTQLPSRAFTRPPSNIFPS